MEDLPTVVGEDPRRVDLEVLRTWAGMAEILRPKSASSRLTVHGRSSVMMEHAWHGAMKARLATRIGSVSAGHSVRSLAPFCSVIPTRTNVRDSRRFKTARHGMNVGRTNTATGLVISIGPRASSVSTSVGVKLALLAIPSSQSACSDRRREISSSRRPSSDGSQLLKM